MTQPRFLSRRAALFTLLGGVGTLTGCTSGGGLSLLGYSTQPNFDPDIRTVYVPIFKTQAFATTPYREMEITLTRFVVDQIESHSPMKVVSDPSGADSELQGTVMALRKNLFNRTPFNGAREIELALTVEIVWHDLRPGREGRILTNPKRRDQEIDEGVVFDPNNRPRPKGPEQARPVTLVTAGRGMPELGETSTTALDMAMKRMATQIVHAMEQPW